MSKLRLLDENENRIKQKEKILGWIRKAVKDDSTKSYDHFVNTFAEKAKYKIISKSILVDCIFDMVVMLLEKKERRQDEIHKIHSDSDSHPVATHRH